MDKARECRLNEITPDEIAMLELIRGIDSQKLRQEFLRQKEPTLEGLGIGRGPTMSTTISRPLPKHERPQILATRKNRLTSGKAWQHPIPMLVASLLIPKPNVVIVAKQNITIAKNKQSLWATMQEVQQNESFSIRLPKQFFFQIWRQDQ